VPAFAAEGGYLAGGGGIKGRNAGQQAGHHLLHALQGPPHLLRIHNLSEVRWSQLAADIRLHLRGLLLLLL